MTTQLEFDADMQQAVEAWAEKMDEWGRADDPLQLMHELQNLRGRAVSAPDAWLKKQYWLAHIDGMRRVYGSMWQLLNQIQDLDARNKLAAVEIAAAVDMAQLLDAHQRQGAGH